MTNRWGKTYPKFNSPEAKAELTAFAAEIGPECGIPEINFTEEGIAKHVQTFFNEQRRYRKNKKPTDKVCVSLFTLCHMPSDSRKTQPLLLNRPFAGPGHVPYPPLEI